MTWEYQTFKLEPKKGWTEGSLNQDELTQILDENGAAGWELVSAFDTNQKYGATREVTLIFKRPRV